MVSREKAGTGGSGEEEARDKTKLTIDTCNRKRTGCQLEIQYVIP